MKSETNVTSTRSSQKAFTYSAPVLRILFVIDGRIRLDKPQFDFGLGFVLDTLRDPSWNTVRVELSVATREESISDAARGGYDVRTGFKFTPADFNGDAWDQVWFFADRPNEHDGGELDTDANILPPYVLSHDEARILAEWMDRGGGVFATGDHGVLGASLCHRIPRVRTMRRWKIADGVPAVDGSRSNRTLQGQNPSEHSEGDTLLQPIELVYSNAVHSIPFRFVDRPHPLLCSDLGPIDHFPDHMHEGELVPDDDVELDKSLGIPGYTRPEYPVAVPEILAKAIGDIGPARRRPRPHIIAYGKTTNPRHLEPRPEQSDAANAVAFALPLLPPKRFGLVSVYDGDVAGLGRVVCDSTWHHWLSINLAGIAEANNADYRKMQAYYRNIALWLARPAQRGAMSLAAVWRVLILSGPMAFSGRRSPWEMGERALALLGGWLAPCWINELAVSQLNASSLYLANRLGKSDSLTPAWHGLPEELVNRAILGAMCHALKPLAAKVRRTQTLRNDVEVDPKEIERLAARGVAKVPTMIRENLDEAIKALGTLRDRVSVAEKRGSKAH